MGLSENNGRALTRRSPEFEWEIAAAIGLNYPLLRRRICGSGKRWRREWDSNPRYGFPHTRFPSVRLKPLGHLSGCPVLKGQDDFCKRLRRRRRRFPQIIEWPG